VPRRQRLRKPIVQLNWQYALLECRGAIDGAWSQFVDVATGYDADRRAGRGPRALNRPKPEIPAPGYRLQATGP
jgi:hypothetical protein